MASTHGVSLTAPLGAPKHHHWAGCCCQALLITGNGLGNDGLTVRQHLNPAVLKGTALVAVWWGHGAPQGAGLGLTSKKGDVRNQSPWQGAAELWERIQQESEAPPERCH